MSKLGIASFVFVLASCLFGQNVMRSRTQGTAERAPAATVFFPLAVGNAWLYRDSAFVDTGALIRITEQVERGGLAYYRIEGFAPTPTLIRMTAGGRLLALDEESGTEKLWYDFSAPSGASWTPERDPCAGVATVRDREAQIETPIGTFRRALQIEYGPTHCADAGFRDEAFGAGVGLLRRTEITIAGPRTLRLAQAWIDGRVIQAPGVSFSLQLDSTSYRPDPEGRLFATLTIANASDQSLNLEFPSGQLYDFAIRDESGETLYFWSATRLFPAVVTTLELSPGARLFEIPVSFSEVGGGPPPGRYVAEAWLTTSGPRRYSATVGFDVAEPER